MDPVLAFNTAASFTTNTNWQNYGGETTMSYLTQMAGLAFHNFVSAAVGIVLAVAVIRGITRRSGRHLGNFWVDLTRCILYILLPICVVFALFLVWQGVPQNFNAYTQVTGIQGFQQLIAQGPVASQEAIKMLGTNGGGFFNANSAHPFENPTPFSNLIEMLSIFSIGAGLIYMFGKMANDTKQGWILFSAVSFLFLIGAFVALGAEQAGNPQLTAIGVDQTANEWALAQPGGNMEGKELRFGIGSSTLFATITTDASCGAVNGFHDSYTPIGGLGPAGQHRAGRDRLWRCWLWVLWLDRLRDPLGLHRWPDGRTHARVSGQEDRAVRDQDGGAGDPDPAARASWSSPRSPSRFPLASRASPIPGRMG